MNGFGKVLGYTYIVLNENCTEFKILIKATVKQTIFG